MSEVVHLSEGVQQSEHVARMGEWMFSCVSEGVQLRECVSEVKQL